MGFPQIAHGRPSERQRCLSLRLALPFALRGLVAMPLPRPKEKGPACARPDGPRVFVSQSQVMMHQRGSTRVYLILRAANASDGQLHAPRIGGVERGHGLAPHVLLGVAHERAHVCPCHER